MLTAEFQKIRKDSSTQVLGWPNNAKKVQKDLKDSKRFQNFQKDSKRLEEIPKHWKRFQKISKVSKRFQKISKGSKRFQKSPEDFKRFKRIQISPKDSKEKIFSFNEPARAQKANISSYYSSLSRIKEIEVPALLRCLKISN